MDLAGLDGAFERITRYEVVLWRQARQVLLALEGLRRRSGPRYRGPRNGWQASEVNMSDEEN